MASSASSASRPRTAARPEKRYGCEVPRVWTPPLRPLTPETSLGFAFIEFAVEVLGMELLPWQRWLAIHALELLPDGSPRFRTVVLLVARQNGKSTFMQVLALFVMYVLGRRLVIGTAQNLDIAEDVWAGAVEIAEEVPELAAEIAHVDKTNGKKSLRLVGRQRYKVQTASRRGGRGLSGDLVLMDELREHQTWDAWGAVTKTTLARALAQVWAASNAGDASSIVLRFLRKAAHLELGDPDGLRELTEVVEPDEDLVEQVDEEELALGIFEWSAPPGCDLDDRDGWAQANPSLGYTITERAIAASRRTDPEWVFRTEVLCQWSDGSLEGPFPPGSWEAGVYPEDPPPDPPPGIPDGERFTFAVDVSWDRSTSHIGVAGRRPDGSLHVEVVASRAGTDWVIPWLKARLGTAGLLGIALQGSGAPVSSLVPDLEKMLDEYSADENRTGPVPALLLWQGADLGRGCGDLYDLVREGALWHLPQPVLDIAAAVAAVRPSQDAWVWDRKKSPADIAPLVAITAAAWALDAAPEPEPDFRSAYEDDDLMVV